MQKSDPVRNRVGMPESREKELKAALEGEFRAGSLAKPGER